MRTSHGAPGNSATNPYLLIGGVFGRGGSFPSTLRISNWWGIDDAKRMISPAANFLPVHCHVNQEPSKRRLTIKCPPPQGISGLRTGTPFLLKNVAGFSV